MSKALFKKFAKDLHKESSKPPLNPKQLRFCQEYLVDHNATQAAIRAGYAEKTARQMGTENLSKPVIAEFIKKADEKVNKKLLKKHEVSQEAIIQELAACGFSVISDFVDWSGQGVVVKDSKTVDARAVKSLKEDKDGNIAITLHGKVESLKKLAEIAGMKMKKVESKDINDAIPTQADFEKLDAENAELEAKIRKGIEDKIRRETQAKQDIH